ncbi:UNVERIFIED_CONTAM: Retrovirus-related Pol polyprotein from transposon RE1 [Sesamum radiatum]|uniref:Retrovirus-related Pol polyprotein from transposon RE1 n=1 Tax=Sesamum radiatum TaxID=300843 RepID=A0AAW2Q0P5_SESRA
MATGVAESSTGGEIARTTPVARSTYGSEVLQLLSSDHPGLILVSSPLDGKNFHAWSRAVRRALGAKSKLGFITGTCVKPTGDPELIEQWTRVDCMVALWLLNAMTKSISNAFIYAKSARSLWIVLNQRYGQCNGPLLYQLEREISSATQGDLTVVDYFTKIQLLWDELIQLRPLRECTCGCTCTCGIAKDTDDLIEERQLMQFLMGLNDEYDNIHSQILVNEPLPSVNMAYSLVLRVEKQRQVHMNVIEPPEGVAIHTGVYDRKKDGNNFRRRGAVAKRGLKCEHCNRLGHDKTTCFKLHGMPDWYKELNDQRKKNTTGGKVVYAVHNAERTVQHEEKKEEKASVSDVVMELMRVLKKIPKDPIQAHYADDYAGMNFTFSGIEYLAKDTWIIDSGATSHMCSNSNLFHNLDTSISSSIFLLDGTIKQVTQSGLVNLFGKLKLLDTLYVPSFCSNLIYVHKICSTSNIRFTFSSSYCVLQDHLTKDIVAIARQSKHLYILDRNSFSTSFIKQFMSSHFSFTSQVSDTDFLLWHKRLGHPSHKILEHVPVLKSSIKSTDVCHICPLAKQHRLPFPSSNSNDHSRATWTFLMRHKSQSSTLLSIFFQSVKSLSLPFFVTGPISADFPLPILPLSSDSTDIVPVPTASSQSPVVPVTTSSSAPSTAISSPTSSPSTHTPLPVRHSTRLTHKPAWLSDFICNHSSSFSAAHTQFVAQLSILQEPKSYVQAQGREEWERAMAEELQALEQNETWTLTSLPKGKNAIGSRWIYKLKLNPDGSVNRYKARLVAKGYSQIEGVDYTESFSPVAKNVTVRIFLSIAAAYSWPLHQLDVNNAFLHGFLDEEVHMSPPDGYSVALGQVYKLQKSLYGLKQASRQWIMNLH